LLFVSCDYDKTTSDYKITAYELQGTWQSNDTTVYSGKLVITAAYITITGYSENQTPLLGNDSGRPFRGYTKGTPLKAYTEEGKLYIEDAGQVQEAIPYTWWDDYPSPDYKRKQFLRFTFGGRQETLQKE
jgi:hypothetical protein